MNKTIGRKFEKNKTRLYPYLFFLLITLLFFYPLFLRPNEMIYPAYDILGIFYYEKLFFVKSILNFHQFPLWDPFVFSGSPFLANPTAAVFYPLTWLFLFFPIYSLFGFLFCLDIFLAGSFTYLYCKSINMDIFPSLISSISFMFSGILITLFIPGHLVVLDTVIWFPLLLLFANRIIYKQSYKNIVLLGLVIALTIFAGHIQISFYSLLFTCFYFLLLLLTRIFSHKNTLIFRPLLAILASFLIGVGISFIQLLPTLEFASLSSRALGVTFQFASSFSIHPYQIISLILPHFFGDNTVFWGRSNFPGSSVYIGVLSLFFILFAFLKKNQHLLFFCLLALLAFVYAAGEHLPLFPFLFSLFPKLNSFRVPSRTLFYFVFSLSIMSGIGSQNFIIYVLSNIKFIKKVILGMVLAEIFFILLILFMYVNPNALILFEKLILRNSFAQGMDHAYIFQLIKEDMLVLSTITLILAAMLVLFASRRINILTFKILLIFLILLDLFSFGQTFIQTKNTTEIFTSDIISTTISNDKSLYRVFDIEGAFQGLQNDLIPNATGVHSLYLRSLQSFIYKSGPHYNQDFESFFLFSDISNPEILRILNVKYVIAHKKIDKPYLIFLSAQGNTYLYKLVHTYHRAYFSELKDNEGYFIPDKTPNIVKIKNYTPNLIELNTNIKTPGKIILSEINYPGWKATVDSKQTNIQTVNGIFRSVSIKKGNHIIRFFYDPLSFKLGGIISGITVSSLIIIFVALKKRFI